MTTTSLNPNVPFAIKIFTDLAVGFAVRSGAAGDATKESNTAKIVIGVAQGLLQANDGDVIDGLNAVDAAVQTGNADPAMEMAIQTAIAWAGTKATAAQNLYGGTVTGLLAAQITSAVANEAIAVAQKYVLPASASVVDPVADAPAAPPAFPSPKSV